MDPIVKKVNINAPVSRVWDALTKKSELEKWMLMTTDFSAEKGRAFIFKTDDPGENWDGIFNCRIEDVIENNFDAIPDHDLLVGGFPCQDYSVATTLKNSKGLIGKKGLIEVLHITSA